MKKSIICVFLSVLAISFVSSCKKRYPEGPSISLLSRKERLANNWHLQSYMENGVDKTADFNNSFQGALLSINANGTYSFNYKLFGLISVNEQGNWNFLNNDKDFETKPTSSTGSNGLHHILKLKDKELWYYDDPDSNGIKREYHLVP